MFSSLHGKDIYSTIVSTVEKENMHAYIKGGILVGFSGGADSVMLMCFLSEYRRRCGEEFPILAVHVNHGIRGKEADGDEEFSRGIAGDLGIEFKSISVDVPKMKDELGLGLEEAARNARYSIFADIIEGREDISTIAIAHNATDNTETVLMNILRGSGLSGVCGIKPVRDNIIRPLIAVSKSEIVSLLDEHGISYVTDSTNLSSDYSRNYVRNEILPMLSRLASDPDAAFSRLTDILRSDLDFINSQADAFIKTHCDTKIYATDLRALHPSLFAKVIAKLIHQSTGVYPEEKHISALRELLRSDNFRYALPGDKYFACQRGICTFSPKKSENDLTKQIFSLTRGENKISGTNLTVYIGDTDKTSLNVYKFSIQASLSSDIIDSGLTLRFKKDGDSYRYSGMTHKLKKVFNDRNIPMAERSLIPVICDAEGILLLPGMSVRDGARSDISENNISITFAYGEAVSGEAEVFTALLRK